MLNYVQMGIRIKDLREKASPKLSQLELAKKLKVDKESVRLYEKGKSITLQKIEQIAAVFEETEEFIMFGRLKAPAGAPEELIPPQGLDARAPTLGAHFSWLNEPEKKRYYLEIRSHAEANRVMLSQMVSGKLKPPPDEYVAKKLHGKEPERRGRGDKK